MNTYQIVRTEHLNHFKKLFGGYMLLWVDEFAWLTASRDFPGCSLVTRSMDKIDFTCPVESGSILRFNIMPESTGNTSVVYSVNVFADAPGAEDEKLVFTNKVTFVNVDKSGKTVPLPEKLRPLRSELTNC
ncbi:MAG: acyl-CoA thioesterase [Spirochaetes bacterium]|nr:acyl-CoA thioesterase [Spirochaetota bacterium]